MCCVRNMQGSSPRPEGNLEAAGGPRLCFTGYAAQAELDQRAGDVSAKGQVGLARAVRAVILRAVPPRFPLETKKLAVSMDQGRMRQGSLSPEVPLERRRTSRHQVRRTGRARWHACQLSQGRNRWRPGTVGSRQIARLDLHVFVSRDNMRESNGARRRINGAAALKYRRFEKWAGGIQMRIRPVRCLGSR